MMLRAYQPDDRESCIDVFNSNCPAFFDEKEREMFVKWLDHMDGNGPYSSPAYSNSVHDAYYVVDVPNEGIVGCGGFYIMDSPPEARMAWGMIHSGYHRLGFGAALFNYRKTIIKKDWPGRSITLGTSQHTFPFYEKMGLNVSNFVEAGFGADLHRYDMRE